MLETFGSIIKEEQVVALEKGILPNTAVLENLGLYPGYYGAHIPEHEKPDTVFLIINKKIPTEDVFRYTYEIRKRTGINFEGAPATITIFNNEYQAIRVRNIAGFENVAEVQEYYKDYGVTFAKQKRLEGVAVIQIKKIFRVEHFTDRILKDLDDDMFYLKIDKQLTWGYFKKITSQVRHNVTVSAFDAALAVIYGSEVLDLIRIYSKSITEDELKVLHDKYEEFIKRSF
ncbi:MAG: hypothetical protein GXO47_03325 [Chlorobi bacterium]|nr:hypothetical protein [Chlorobiota bacterium]